MATGLTSLGNSLGRFNLGRYVRQLRVFVASPGDVQKERGGIFNLIENMSRSLYAKSISVQPVGWERDVYPQIMDGGAQEAINSQLLVHCDVLIGLIGYRAGSPTRFFDSGTFEEIERFIELERPTLIYFKNVRADDYATDIDKKRIEQFKHSLFKRGLIGSYKSTPDLKFKIQRDLGKIVFEFEKDWNGRIGDLLHKAEESNYTFAKPIGNINVGLNFIGADDCKCRCVCFQIGTPRISNFVIRWEKVQEFEVEDHGFVDRREILDAMNEPYNSYKFYISVNKRKLEYYRGLLLDRNMLITGKGDPDPECEENWRIWFLLPDGYIHPLVESPEYANHSLFDLCVI